MVLLSLSMSQGLGFGIAFTTCVVVISVYFLKLRPLAQGISGTGVSVGNMCFPWVTSALISTFTWRGIRHFSMNMSSLV